MFVIKDIQLEAFRKREVAKFVEKSKLFLQQNFEKWCQKKDDDALKIFIQRTIESGADVNIRKQNNVQKLLFLQIEYQLNFPLKGEYEKIMLERNVSEDQRITSLHKTLDRLRKRNELSG